LDWEAVASMGLMQNATLNPAWARTLTEDLSQNECSDRIVEVREGLESKNFDTHHRDHALNLAAHGFYVFPCRSDPDARRDKAPLGVSRREASSNDPVIIENWWRRYPHALVAID
jgi:hypothetical protein